MGERVAVVVVMYNSRSLLPDFLASLDDGLRGVAYQLIAVDNASPDDSADYVAAAAPQAVVVRTGRNGGYAAGINAGVRAAGPHTAVLVVNSDVRLGTGCVRELLGAVRRDGVGIAVPRLVDGAGQVIDSMRREPTVARALGDAIFGAQNAGRFPVLGEVVSNRRVYDREHRVDWAEGSTQLITAECWRACGPWDESFFLYSEETEYDLRARDHGFATVFVPTAHAIHLAGGSGLSHELWILQVHNRIRLFRRRHGRVATTLYWAATLLRESTRAAMGRAGSRAAARALLDPRRFGAPPAWQPAAEGR